MIKITLIVITLLHGLIHLMGGLNELGIAKIEGVARTLFPLSPAVKMELGVVWLIALALFLGAAYGLIANKAWWQPVIIAAVVVSQILTILWWPDAKFGTIANILIISLMLLYKRS